MKRYILGCLTVAVVFGCWVASVRAEDIWTPPWDRGLPRTTQQGWTFATDGTYTSPDEYYNNPYGTPEASINAGTSQWSQYYHNHIGVWTLGAGNNISLDIPNTPPDDTKNKYVWTQLYWQPDNNGIPVVTVDGNVATLMDTQTEPGGWIASAYEFVLPHNPAAEDVIVTGSLSGTTFDLGEVYIDTICTVPEPSSLALLAVGALSLLHASRKQRLAA